MNTQRGFLAALPILLLVGCADAISQPEFAQQVELQAQLDASTQPGLCTADFTLTTQAEVDAFNCTHVVGRVWIGPSTDITNLDAFSGLVSVDGALVAVSNEALQNVDGLSSLTTVRDLVFSGNHALANVDGFSAITSITDILLFTGNDGLTNLDGLSALVTVPTIEIHHFSTLTRLALPALTSVDRFTIYSSVALSEISLPSLSHVGFFEMDDNDALTNLDGLSGLGSVSYLGLLRLRGLGNIDGVASLSRADFIFIAENASLKNVDGFSGLTSVDDFVLLNNPVLSKCACGLYALLDSGGINNLQLTNNAPGCNSASEITPEACVTCASTELTAAIEAFVASGDLAARDGRWLANRLRGVLRQADKGHLSQVVRGLERWTAYVSKLEVDGKIGPNTGDALRTRVQTLQRALEAQAG